MGDWYRKKPYNQCKEGHEKKTTTDKRVVARKVIDELNKRIESEQGLSDVDTVHLLKFLQGVMPRESTGTIDHNINLITNTPRPQVIDVTPDKVRITGKETDGDGVDGSHNEW